MNLPQLPRRTFLLGSVGISFLAACGGDSDSSSDGADGDDSQRSFTLLAPFPDGFSFPPLFEVGTRQRPIYALHDGETYLREGSPPALGIEVRYNGELVEAPTLLLHDDGIPTPYYPYWFTPDRVGGYDVRIPGSDVITSFLVTERGETGIPQVGDIIVGIETPTDSNPAGVEPLCTRVPDQCGLHAKSWTEVLSAEGPKVLIISTPGFCQTAICGPVLELVLDMLADYPNVTFVHSEVYTDPFNDDAALNRVPTETMTQYNLGFEPVLFVVDAQNKITARLDTTWDRADLQMVLDEVS